MSKHIQWAIRQLSELGYQVLNPSPEIIQDTQWSEVSRFETDRGFVFFKTNATGISHRTQNHWYFTE